MSTSQARGTPRPPPERRRGPSLACEARPIGTYRRRTSRHVRLLINGSTGRHHLRNRGLLGPHEPLQRIAELCLPVLEGMASSIAMEVHVTTVRRRATAMLLDRSCSPVSTPQQVCWAQHSPPMPAGFRSRRSPMETTLLRAPRFGRPRRMARGRAGRICERKGVNPMIDDDRARRGTTGVAHVTHPNSAGSEPPPRTVTEPIRDHLRVDARSGRDEAEATGAEPAHHEAPVLAVGRVGSSSTGAS